ncbi:MAG: hypothetical protein J1E03_04420 [Acetatifactor sp.]|nr:hypothetical protein [Acetatifactor sp.]
MKKKVLMMLCVTIMCVGLVACGGEDAKPTTNSNSASPAVSESTTAPTVTPTVEPEQTPVAEDTSESEEFEDVIGDYDFDIVNITIDDMVPAEFGVDLPINNSSSDLTWGDIGLDGLTILFPRAMYWTLQGPDMSGVVYTIANNDDRSVEFKINFRVLEGVAKADGKTEVYDYGRYIVGVRNNDPRAGKEGENLKSAGYTITISDTETNTYAQITIGAGMNTDNGEEVITAYREAFLSDILAQVEAMAQ